MPQTPEGCRRPRQGKRAPDTASIQKQPNGRYKARYRDDNGSEHAQRFDKKGDAQAWLDAQMSSILVGSHVDPRAGKVTFDAFADEWLSTKADVAASTMLNVKGRLRKHAKPFFGGMQVSSVRPTHARAFVAALVATRPRAVECQGIVLTTGQVFDQAVDDCLIARSPFANVALPRDRSSRRDALP